MMMLRDRLRARDIWLEGSRTLQAFDDFLLPCATRSRPSERLVSWGSRSPSALTVGATSVARRSSGGPGKWQVATLASAGKLPEALITEAGLSISPIRQNDTDVDDVAWRLYGMLPCLPDYRIAHPGPRLDRFCRAFRPPSAPARRQRIRSR